MHNFTPLSATEQLADHLREEALAGRLAGEMPGVLLLSKSLGVSPKTVIAATRQLEEDGFLIRQGAGRRSRVVLPEDFSPRSLRIEMLLYEKSDTQSYYRVDLQHQLIEAGHAPRFTSSTLTGMGMKVSRTARLVAQSEADAWIVFSASREILEWFAGQSIPALAFAGRRRGVPIASAGPDKPPAVRTAVRRLIELGHRRMVSIVREERRKPIPGLSEQAFLDELQAHGITTSPFNLPSWDGTPKGLRDCLESLYSVTPPTAILIDEMPLFYAVQAYLSRRGILAPEQVSLICTDPDPAFAWTAPSVAHIHWDPRPTVRRIVRWANNIARGKSDQRQSYNLARYVEGGTVGPAP